MFRRDAILYRSNVCTVVLYVGMYPGMNVNVLYVCVYLGTSHHHSGLTRWHYC